MHRSASFESLESRTHLSVSPGYLGLRQAHGDLHVVQPLRHPVSPPPPATPAGYSPAQVLHAYGFDKISFSGVAGDGTGQTIAIVDAYDDPNIASDLAAFDTQFKL